MRRLPSIIRYMLLACITLPPSATANQSLIQSEDLPWKVNAFAVARWKTLVGGNEGGQIDAADVQFGLWELAPHSTYHGHRHPAPEIYHVVAGQGLWTIGDTTHTVGPGSTLYTRSGVVHKMVNTGDLPLRTIWFWWAPDGRREVLTGAYEFTESAPEPTPDVPPWPVADEAPVKLY